MKAFIKAVNKGCFVETCNEKYGFLLNKMNNRNIYIIKDGFIIIYIYKIVLIYREKFMLMVHILL